jgi:tetrahydromethanopterin S-methyltransferase subunit D
MNFGLTESPGVAAGTLAIEDRERLALVSRLPRDRRSIMAVAFAAAVVGGALGGVGGASRDLLLCVAVSLFAQLSTQVIEYLFEPVLFLDGPDTAGEPVPD